MILSLYSQKMERKIIDWMNPHSYSNLIDVASGTGDIAKLL